MDSATEVRYGGVIIGRSPQIRDRTDGGAFVVFGEPMPVGTPIVFKLDDKERHARVTEVVEAADAAAAGMRVRFISAADARPRDETPAPQPPRASRPAAAAAPEPAPAPAVERPAAAPAPAVAEASQPASSPVPVPIGGDASSGTGSTGVPAGESSAHHAPDPNAPHHDGEGGRRRRRRK